MEIEIRDGTSQTIDTDPTPGQIAYAAWRQANGDKPPRWYELTAAEIEAWDAVAEAVRSDLLDAQDSPDSRP